MGVDLDSTKLAETCARILRGVKRAQDFRFQEILDSLPDEKELRFKKTFPFVYIKRVRPVDLDGWDYCMVYSLYMELQEAAQSVSLRLKNSENARMYVTDDEYKFVGLYYHDTHREVAIVR